MNELTLNPQTKMKTNIEALDNPNSDKTIQAQIVRTAIYQHKKLIREWTAGPKRNSRGVETMIREYTSRLKTLEAAL